MKLKYKDQLIRMFENGIIYILLLMTWKLRDNSFLSVFLSNIRRKNNKKLQNNSNTQFVIQSKCRKVKLNTFNSNLNLNHCQIGCSAGAGAGSSLTGSFLTVVAARYAFCSCPEVCSIPTLKDISRKKNAISVL